MSSSSKKFLSSAEITKVVTSAFKQAAKDKAKAALCGGFAMQLYGSDRMTKDIDFLADAPLSWKTHGTLSFGGLKYDLKGVPVDWILRDDEQSFLYQAALEDRTKSPEGFWVLRPEWLAIIKLLARRGKDGLDLLFLLRTPGLVDRSKVKKHIKALFGPAAFAVQDDMNMHYLEADLMRARDNE